MPEKKNQKLASLLLSEKPYHLQISLIVFSEYPCRVKATLKDWTGFNV